PFDRHPMPPRMAATPTKSACPARPMRRVARTRYPQHTMIRPPTSHPAPSRRVVLGRIALSVACFSLSMTAATSAAMQMPASGRAPEPAAAAQTPATTKPQMPPKGKAPKPAAAAPAVQPEAESPHHDATFRVFLAGRPVGSQTVLVDVSDTEWRVRATGQ